MPKIKHAERGQTLPLLGVVFVVLLGFAGLAVDAGYERYQQRAQQSATDSAALAGASELTYTQTGWLAAARAEAASNGFAHDGVNTIVTVNNPPTSGPNAGNSKAIEVVIDGTRPTFFEAALGTSTQTLETRSSALLAPPTRRPCIYALGPPPSGLRLNSPNLNAPNCGIVSNGDYRSNSGTVASSEIGVYGAIASNSTTYTGASPQATVAVSDPCATIPACLYLRNNPPATSPCVSSGASYHGTITLSPGVYCGGTTFSASNVSLNPGTYVFIGGLTSNASVITGSGVTLAFPTGGVTTLNAGSFDIAAPTSGALAGLAFYQPPSNTASITLNGGSGTRLIDGVVYAPSAQLTSNASFGSETLLVAADITLNSGTMNVPTNLNFSNGVQSVVLTQ